MNKEVFEVKKVNNQNKVYVLRYNIDNLPFDLETFDEVFCKLYDFFKNNDLLLCGIPFETDLITMGKEELIKLKEIIDNMLEEIDKHEKI